MREALKLAKKTLVLGGDTAGKSDLREPQPLGNAATANNRLDLNQRWACVKRKRSQSLLSTHSTALGDWFLLVWVGDDVAHKRKERQEFRSENGALSDLKEALKATRHLLVQYTIDRQWNTEDWGLAGTRLEGEE